MAARRNGSGGGYRSLLWREFLRLTHINDSAEVPLRAFCARNAERCIVPRTFVNALFGTLFAGFLAIFPAASSADHVGQTLVVDGMEVYLGIMAAEILREHPEQYPYHERKKIPSGSDMYHGCCHINCVTTV